jgi:GNAT superfamily N-acetyltransferase
MGKININTINIVNLRKSVLYDFLDPSQFPYENTRDVFRGIGQKELDFIRAHGYIASKGKGNDADQESTTCFSQLYSQAEGYARSQYDLYNETQGYVLALEKPLTATENELGEVEVVGKVSASAIKAIMPIDQLNKALVPKSKGITRTQAKGVHKDLPPGGEWRTMGGHHIYILNGKVLAGAIPGVTGAKKATKAHVAEHQANIDKEAKAKKPAPKKPAPKKPAPKKATPKAKAEPAKKTAVKPKVEPAKKTAVKPKVEPKLVVAKDKKAQSKADTAKAKADIDEITAKPNPKSKPGKSASKEDLDKLAKTPNKKIPQGKGATKKDLDEVLAGNPKKPAPTPTTKKDLDELFGFDTSVDYSKKPPTKKGVAVIRSAKQTNNDTAYDVGKKIGGARKDEAELKAKVEKLVGRSSGQSLDELEKMSSELAQKYCVKKNIVAPVDFEAEYKSGTDINVAMCKKLIYDRIAPKPPTDTAQSRAEYLNASKELQRVLEPIKSWDELKSAIRELGKHMKKETPQYEREQNKYLEYAKTQVDKVPTAGDLRPYDYRAQAYKDITPVQFKQEKLDRVKEIEADIAKGKELAKKPFAPLGEKLTNFFTDNDSANRTIDTISKKKLNWEMYLAEARKASEAPPVPKGEANKAKWEDRMPAKIQRKGGRVSKVDKPEDMIKTFNFKGVEFGNWVDDTSGNFHLKKCAEAFADLADIVGISDKDVSFNGKLAMAFGARGKGRALAHYECSSKVINITKEGGAGSLAHEWGHALDNMMYQESVGRPSMNLGANGLGDEGTPEIKSAYKELMEDILHGDGDGVEEIENKHTRWSRYPSSYKKAVEELGIKGAIKYLSKTIDAEAEKSKAYYERIRGQYSDEMINKKLASAERKRNADKRDMGSICAQIHEQATGEVLATIPMYTGMSKYYQDSKEIAGGNAKYWCSNEELFARGFASYVEDKMIKGKVKNDYLAYGTKFADADMAPYPKGTEREKIVASFDKLMKVIAKSGAIKKAIAIEALAKGYYKDKLIAMQERKDPESIVSPTHKFYTELKDSLAETKGEKDKFFNIADMDVKIAQRSRNAYNVSDTSEVIYIPVNRLSTPYQTEGALNFDKIHENVGRMASGENLEPIVIGFSYDVHDGCHRLEASKIMKYTHVPCIVGGSNDLDVQRAKEEYAELWKSFSESDHPRDEKGQFTVKSEIDEKDWKNWETGGHIASDNLTLPGGELKVMLDSPYAGGKHAVFKTLVDEEHQNKGIGGKLIDEAIRKYGDKLSAQTSSLNSTRIYYNHGFRPTEDNSATLKETLKMFKDKGSDSLGMEYIKKSLGTKRDTEEYTKVYKSVSGGTSMKNFKEEEHNRDGKGMFAKMSSGKDAKDTVQKYGKPLYSNSKRGEQTTSPQNKKDVSNMNNKGAGKDEQENNRGQEKAGSTTGDTRQNNGDGQNGSGGNGKAGMGQKESGRPSKSSFVEYAKVTDPKVFHSAISKAKANNDHGNFVDVHDEADYAQDSMLMSPEGGAGVAVTPDGDIISVFKDPSSTEKGALHSIMMNAIGSGGKTLDCYDGYLPINYARYGMVPVARLKFNPAYVENWNTERDGTPDVVFMAHNGDDMETIKANFGKYPAIDMSKVPYIEEYDDGGALQKKYMEEMKAKKTSKAVEAKVATTK